MLQRRLPTLSTSPIKFSVRSGREDYGHSIVKFSFKKLVENWGSGWLGLGKVFKIYLKIERLGYGPAEDVQGQKKKK
jgi:hypothetical protein